MGGVSRYFSRYFSKISGSGVNWILLKNVGTCHNGSTKMLWLFGGLSPSPRLLLLGCFFAYSWKLPAYSWAFLITVVFGSFSLTVELFTYSLSFFAYSPQRPQEPLRTSQNLSELLPLFLLPLYPSPISLYFLRFVFFLCCSSFSSAPPYMTTQTATHWQLKKFHSNPRLHWPRLKLRSLQQGREKYTPPPWKPSLVFSFSFSGSQASMVPIPFFPDLWYIPFSLVFTGKWYTP